MKHWQTVHKHTSHLHWPPMQGCYWVFTAGYQSDIFSQSIISDISAIAGYFSAAALT